MSGRSAILLKENGSICLNVVLPVESTAAGREMFGDGQKECLEKLYE